MQNAIINNTQKANTAALEVANHETASQSSDL